jgi:hypothetical protein
MLVPFSRPKQNTYQSGESRAGEKYHTGFVGTAKEIPTLGLVLFSSKSDVVVPVASAEALLALCPLLSCASLRGSNRIEVRLRGPPCLLSDTGARI